MSPAERVPPEPPWRVIRAMIDAGLQERSPPWARLSSSTGRPSIAPEQWRRTLLRPGLYTVRSERRLLAHLHDHLLWRWVVGLHLDAPIGDPSTCSQNRERLREGAVAHACCAQVLAHARERDLLSAEHVTVDGTLIEAGAGPKRVKRQETAPPEPPPDAPGHPSLDVRGERRTHVPRRPRPPIPRPGCTTRRRGKRPSARPWGTC
jgi:transposase